MSDLAWWGTFQQSWNGTSMLLPRRRARPDAVVISNASGSWGCGAYWGHEWLQLQWKHDMRVDKVLIAFKELVPVVLAATAWGRQWRGMVVQCQSDNMATVTVINTRTSQDANMMHLLRCLFLFEATWEFCFSATYIQGRNNDKADDISQGRTLSLLSKVPAAAPYPTLLQPAAIDMLMRAQPSPNWRQRFNTILLEG